MSQYLGIRKNKHLQVSLFKKLYYKINKCIFYFFFLGFGLGSVEGRVAIHYIQPQSSKDNFTFKCHRQNNSGTMNVQDIYAVCICKINKSFLCYLIKLMISGE